MVDSEVGNKKSLYDLIAMSFFSRKFELMNIGV